MTARGSWVTGGLSPDAVVSFASLLVSLDRLAETGCLAPCQQPTRAHWWTSEDREEREAAAYGCAGCPLLDTCTAHAPHEPAHVWGVDRSPTTGKAQ
jgi:hypothetical protein